jgi:hypothetical protein
MSKEGSAKEHLFGGLRVLQTDISNARIDEGLKEVMLHGVARAISWEPCIPDEIAVDRYVTLQCEVERLEEIMESFTEQVRAISILIKEEKGDQK